MNIRFLSSLLLFLMIFNVGRIIAMDDAMEGCERLQADDDVRLEEVFDDEECDEPAAKCRKTYLGDAVACAYDDPDELDDEGQRKIPIANEWKIARQRAWIRDSALRRECLRALRAVAEAPPSGDVAAAEENEDALDISYEVLTMELGAINDLIALRSGGSESNGVMTPTGSPSDIRVLRPGPYAARRFPLQCSELAERSARQRLGFDIDAEGGVF